MVVLCGHAGEESEGDVVIAAEFATPQTINFMIKQARGPIFLALTERRCGELGLESARTKGQLQSSRVLGDGLDRGQRRHHDRDLSR